MQQTEAAVERVFRARPSECASLCPVQRHSAENSDVLTCKRRRTGSRFPNALIRSSVAAEKKKKRKCGVDENSRVGRYAISEREQQQSRPCCRSKELTGEESGGGLSLTLTKGATMREQTAS